MNYVPLSDEENYAILTESFGDSLGSLGRIQQLQVLKAVHKLLDSPSPERYIYETVENCDELQVIRAGNSLRVYCRLVMGVPHENETYNVLFVFYVDTHEYRSAVLTRFDDRAEERLTALTDLSAVDDVDSYLEEHDAKRAEFVEKQIDRA